MRLYAILAGLFTCAAASPAFAGPMAEARSYIYLYTQASDDLMFTGTPFIQSTSGGNGNISINKTESAQYISADVIASLDNYGESNASEVVDISVMVTNISNYTITAPIGLEFAADIDSDASIDSGLLEDASFSSSLHGTAAGDDHACEISPYAIVKTGAVEISTSGGQSHCAVPSPDFSESYLDVDLAPGESMTLGSWELNASAHVDWYPVPEPASGGLFVSGICALALLRSRRFVIRACHTRL